ncbi:MAG: MmgE/PrpD family protein [Syntrophales bacterium LBB04]|nr:MmgE/PrpD family protein [Syntrophales bacterium LBB04]
MQKSVIKEISSYISRSGQAELPPEVIVKAKHHILDTITAIVSGSKLKAGKIAIQFIGTQKGVKEAQVVGSRIITSAINAALSNGMMAHADETDDSHEKSLTHPGAAAVPAALAIAERERANGMRFLKGVVAGYDIGCRITQALGVDTLRKQGRSTHSLGGTFGAAAAAASILRLKEDLVRYVLSYATHQASGALYYVRDEEHVEKSFVFAGMPARNGVTAAILVLSGFSGVSDPFTGDRNFFEGFPPTANPARLVEGLGSHYEIMETNIKKFAVGSPIQAPVDALLIMMAKHTLIAQNIESIAVYLPNARAVNTVNNRDMPDINLQYLLAATLLDGELTYEAAHSYERMRDPAVVEVKKRISLASDPDLLNVAKTGRQALVQVTMKDGTHLKERVTAVRGTAGNPLSSKEVDNKCRDLLSPILGRERTARLIDRIWNLEKVTNMRNLRSLLTAPKNHNM